MIWGYLVPHLTGAAIAAGAAYLALTRWVQIVALTYLLWLVFQKLYRLALRRIRPALFEQIRRAARRPIVFKPTTVRRSAIALGCTALLAVALPPTIYARSLRETITDAGFYARQIPRCQVYDALIDLVAGETPRLARKQDPLIKNAIHALDEKAKRQAAQILLPERWTQATIEQALGVTLEWLQSEGRQRVPGITVSVADLARHTTEALSFALDEHIAAMPVCPAGIAASTSCRPAGMSRVAYAATYKPDALASIGQTFELLPAQVDLSTAVTISPRTFQTPLAALEQIRLAIQTVDRAWNGAAFLCLLATLGLLLSSAVSIRATFCWGGLALFVIAARTWALCILAPSFAPALLPRPGPAANAMLNGLLERALTDLAWTIHARLFPAALVLAALGLTLIAAGGLLPARSSQYSPRCAARAIMIALSAGVLIWYAYLDLGRRQYEQAYAAHRAGDVSRAVTGYRWIARLYPFRIDDFVQKAHAKLREGDRFMLAEQAYHAGKYESAARQYEALLAQSPAIALQEQARPHLMTSLYHWAESLRNEGEYERALDRYHFIQTEFRDREINQSLASLYFDWGDALLQSGDHQAAIATYRRLTVDVVNARLWSEADAHARQAYCAWSQFLHEQGQIEQARRVCQQFEQAFPDSEAGRCPACN